MFGFAFALVPLYDTFWSSPLNDGKTRSVAEDIIKNRLLMKIEPLFSLMPISTHNLTKFRPTEFNKSYCLVSCIKLNITQNLKKKKKKKRAITGRATYSAVPGKSLFIF